MVFLNEIREFEIKQFIESLLPSEKAILKALAEGCNNPAIADKLCVGVKTVERHMNTMRHKYLDCTNVSRRSVDIRVLMNNAYWKVY